MGLATTNTCLAKAAIPSEGYHAMTHAKLHTFSVRLPAFQRWATYGTLIAVAASGVAWLVLHDWMQSGWFVEEHRLLVMHGVAAAFSLTVIGGLLPLHIRLAWRIRRNLWSGAIVLLTMGMLGLTGLLLYYGNEEGRDIVRWVHIGIGVLGIAAVPVHVWMGKRRLARQQQPNPQETQPLHAVRHRG